MSLISELNHTFSPNRLILMNSIVFSGEMVLLTIVFDRVDGRSVLVLDKEVRLSQYEVISADLLSGVENTPLPTTSANASMPVEEESDEDDVVVRRTIRKVPKNSKESLSETRDDDNHNHNHNHDHDHDETISRLTRELNEEEEEEEEEEGIPTEDREHYITDPNSTRKVFIISLLCHSYLVQAALLGDAWSFNGYSKPMFLGI